MNWEEIISAAATLFLVMDPLGNVPIFNAVLSSLEEKRRTRVLVRELVFAVVILFGFLFAGNQLLSFLGLTQPSLSIAGGVLLFIISLRMIFPRQMDLGEDGEHEPFIVPLAVPMIAGPSAIALLLLLSSNQPGKLLEWSVSLTLAWTTSSAILILSPRLLRVIGMRGSRALGRLMGMILVILSVQMLLNGIRDFVISLQAL